MAIPSFYDLCIKSAYAYHFYINQKSIEIEKCEEE
jgi:hypothetical protein